ncbi:Hypothetical predicted protein, partial [Podarcis lilfordi]
REFARRCRARNLVKSRAWESPPEATKQEFHLTSRNTPPSPLASSLDDGFEEQTNC